MTQAPTPPPKLKTLYFYLSSYCNLNCGHCWIDPVFIREAPAPAEVTLSCLTSVIDQAIPLGLTGVKLTGGEPFMSPHMIPLMRYAAEKKLGITIETNGTLIDDGCAEACKETRVGHLSVSLDGPNAEVHERLRGVPGSFDRAVEGLKKVVARGIATQVIMSVYKRNAAYIEETVRFAASLGAKSLKLNCLSNIARAQSLHEKQFVLTVKEHLALYSRLKETVYPRSPIPVLYDLPPVFTFRDGYSNKSGCTCGIQGILGVLGDGTISICGIGRTIPELVFGHSAKDTIKDIWESSAFLRSIRAGLPQSLEGVCGSCMLRRLCMGKCRAEAYHAKKNIFAPFNFCQTAFDEGLYPMKYYYSKEKEGHRGERAIPLES